MRPVHVSGFAQLPQVLRDVTHDEAEQVQVVTAAALADARLARSDVGFTCSGSNDYVMGRPFSFVTALDGLGAWPPIRESHVEMDGAWALYEAWVRLQHGDVDVALVYAFGKSSLGNVDAVQTMMLDPYVLAPLGVGPLAIAALQARVLLDRGLCTERDFAEVVLRARRHGARYGNVPQGPASDVDTLLAAATVASPLRAHDAAVRTDGAAAIVLTVGGPGPRISGLAHRIDAHHPGSRDLATCRSAALAAEAAGIGRSPVEAAELHVPYSPQELVLTRALALGPDVVINASGGTLVAETPMVAGLVRIGEAANQVRSGAARRALGHATSGPCLQQNLVCILEAT